MRWGERRSPPFRRLESDRLLMALLIGLVKARARDRSQLSSKWGRCTTIYMEQQAETKYSAGPEKCSEYADL